MFQREHQNTEKENKIEIDLIKEMLKHGEEFYHLYS